MVEIGNKIYINGIECKIIAIGRSIDNIYLAYDNIVYKAHRDIDNIMNKICMVTEGTYTYDGQPTSVRSKTNYDATKIWFADIVSNENDDNDAYDNNRVKIGDVVEINKTEWKILSYACYITSIVAEHGDVHFVIGTNKPTYEIYENLPIYRKEDIEPAF